MFDIISYIFGKKAGEKNVVLSDDSNYTYSDPNSDGNIVIEEQQGGDN